MTSSDKYGGEMKFLSLDLAGVSRLFSISVFTKLGNKIIHLHPALYLPRN